MATNQSRSDPGRIEAVELANGDVVVYDVDDTGAWIQSDDTVDAESMA